jgi:RNA polymerase sigma-70 factor, ECF subfamily
MRPSTTLPLTSPAPALVECAGLREARAATLVRLHLQSVWRTLRRLGVPIPAVDDATQEVFVVATRKLDAIEPGKEQQFLYGIALRVAANARRASATHQRFFDDAAPVAGVDAAPPTDALLHAKRMRALLDTVLDALPEDLRTVFVLFELEGWSGPELADLLGVPVGTVASRLRRAREAFREEAALARVRHSSRGEP